MELLSPAGNPQALEAAIAAGADAVYLGYTAFGARAGAGNFNEEELTNAVSLCHSLGIKIYTTVNTLVKEEETGELEEVLKLLDHLKVDGLIVQDIGVAGYVRQNHPSLSLHASTQMAIHNLQGAIFLKDAGFQRVVLARECSLETIKEVAALGIETEVFVHGALCVSQSGQCIFSGMVGERSGNRGRCAQACRLPYQYDGQWGNWLSPKDMNVRDGLKELYEAGVVSLKIEGRVKSKEYVSEVTDFYRKGMNGLLQGKYQNATEKEKKQMAQIFNRGGFTKGYAFGEQDKDVVDLQRVNHQGVSLGRVTRMERNFAFVLVEEDLYPQDGLRFLGKEEIEITYSGPLTLKGSQGKVWLREGEEVRPGTKVMRLWSNKQMENAMKREKEKISVEASLYAVPGEKALLEISDGFLKGTARGETVEPAQKAPLSQENVFTSLAKLKETPFVLTKGTLVGEGGFLPLKTINQLRNKAVEDLIEKRIEAFEKKETTFIKAPLTFQKGEKPSFQQPIIMVRGKDLSLGEEYLQKGAQLFLYAPKDFRIKSLEKELPFLPKDTWLCLPTQLSSQSLQKVAALVKENKEKIKGVALGNLGQLGQDFSVPMAFLDTVPIWNKMAYEELKKYGSTWEMAWPELNEKEIREIEGEGRPFVQMVYGRNRLMTLNHCPARVKLGLNQGREKCSLCMEERKESLLNKNLIDRKGYTFPLLANHQDTGCVIELLNSLPLNLFEKMNESFPHRSILLDFTTESPQEQLHILEVFVEKRQGKKVENPILNGTQGHFNRGVL